MKTNKVRVINDQIKDVAQGKYTAKDIVDEGVGEYGVRYFSPYAAGMKDLKEIQAYNDIYDEWISRQPKESKKEEPKTKLIATGQIWEPCPLCGKEPVYLEYNFHCKECAKK